VACAVPATLDGGPTSVTADDLLARADAAMYADKRAGRRARHVAAR
jgi:GGDEF domain-containing protein